MNQNDRTQLIVASPDQYILAGKKVDLGLLGKLFGSRENAPANIVGLILILLVVAGVIALFSTTSIPAGDFWDKIVPIVTLICGYLFGKTI